MAMNNISSIAVFCGSSIGNSQTFLNEAEKIGKFLAKKNIKLVYGGGNLGLMGTVSNSSLKNGGKVIGVVPDGLPTIQMPQIDFDQLINLGTVAIAISLIGFMEAISIAKAMATQTKQRLDADQELIGQGLSNIVSSFFQGYPVSGSFSRSAVNISAGAVTGFASVVTGLVVGITLLFLTPLLYHLPQATLAAVIITAVINLIKFKPIKYAWRVQKHDAIISIITFFVTQY